MVHNKPKGFAGVEAFLDILNVGLADPGFRVIYEHQEPRGVLHYEPPCHAKLNAEPNVL